MEVPTPSISVNVMVSSLKRHLVRMRRLERVLIWTCQCPYRERHRPEVVVHRWITMGRGSERAPTCEPRREETKPASSLILGLPSSRAAGNKFPFFKPPSLWDFCFRSSRKLVHGPISCVSFLVSLFPNRCVYLKYYQFSKMLVLPAFLSLPFYLS